MNPLFRRIDRRKFRSLRPWLSGWRYRRSHIIHPASGAGTGYQVKINVFLDTLTRFYDLADRFTTISGNPTDRHGFDVVHRFTVVEVNKVVDGATRKYLAYDSDADGNEIRLYYSDDLGGTWTPYTGNPILGPTTLRYRTPTVAWDGTTFHMFLCRRDTREIERWTSTDGITFTFAETVLTNPELGDTLNPFIWFNPNDNQWYLYWRCSDAAGNFKIYARSATNIEDLDLATDVLVLSFTKTRAYPTITYKDNQYWLLLEGKDNAIWHVYAFYSTSPTSGFVECGNSPILIEDEACPKLFLSPDEKEVYLFSNRDVANWYQDTRKVLINASVSLAGHARTDFGDVRFTADDGVTLLDYWVEEQVDGDYAIFWVEVTDDLSFVDVTIYCYYGKIDATSVSDGEATFSFFDDFSVDLSKWTIVSGTWAIEAGELSGETSAFGDRIRAIGFIFADHAVHVTVRWISGTYFEHGPCIRGQADEPSDSYVMVLSTFTGEPRHKIMRRLGGVSATVAGQGTTAPSTGVNYKLILKAYSSTLKGSAAPLYPTEISGTDPNFASGSFCLFSWAGTAEHAHYDNVFVRKYVDPEPSHGAWGIEEAR